MIAVFGASVTQQRNGYAGRLRKYFSCPVKIFGYGGMHLNNAAICFIDNVIEQRPAYCFIDWFSTGYNKRDHKTVEYIDTVIYRFSEAHCRSIFLFLPYKNNPGKKEFHEFCKSILIKKGVPFIDVGREISSCTLKSILRDDIHTTKHGSNLYAQAIYNKFHEIKDAMEIPMDPPATNYINIKRIHIDRVFDNTIKLSGNCEVIGFVLTVGPHSGMVEITNGSDSRIHNTWDRWCHYSRQHFTLPVEVSGNVQLNILPNDFNTDDCCSQIDFKKEKKKLIVQDIYYVGENLEITNIRDGHRIHNLSLLTKNTLGRINRFRNRITRQHLLP